MTAEERISHAAERAWHARERARGAGASADRQDDVVLAAMLDAVARTHEASAARHERTLTRMLFSRMLLGRDGRHPRGLG